jgi:putative membrane protein
MSTREFFGDDARARVKQTIAALETDCAAEVVVAVQPSSGEYRASDYLFGSLLSFSFVLVFVFHPTPFESELLPLELLLVFVLGSAASASLVPLRRLLTPRKSMQLNVLRAAKEKFVDLAITRTRDRSGVLVYVSMFERRAVVITDLGIDRKAHDKAITIVERRLSEAVAGADMNEFMTALSALGPALSQACPPRADDVNELPDEPEVA